MESPSAKNLPSAALPQAAKHAVSEAAVRGQLERLLASSVLRDSDLLRRFLRYIVEHTLAGEGDQLKEYRLGVEVFDRDASFDPKIDPVVRMSARRLRAKLHEYYENGGLRDAVRIEVPRGAYAACFVASPASQPLAGEETPGPGKAEQVDRVSPGRVPGGWKWSFAGTALLLIAALAAGGFYYRSRQAKRLTDKDTVVISDFANSTGDPVFDDTLKTALSISLRQSPFLNVLPEDAVAKTLQLMARPADSKLMPDVARELCQRAGSQAYIAGAIGSLGSEFVLGLKAVNCENGDTLAEEQATAASKEKVLDTLGRVASKLRGELGESLATVQKLDVPLAEATTTSLDALKAYSLGDRAYDLKGPAAALPYHQHAIELDANFAMGYMALGNEYWGLGELERANEYFTKAFQVRQHASEREKLGITAAYYSSVTGELDKAAQAYREEIESYPRGGAYGDLAEMYAEEGQHEKAAEITRQAMRLKPDEAGWYENLAHRALALQRLAEARQILLQAPPSKVDSPLFHNALYGLAFLEADSAAMAEQGRWFADKPDYESWGLSLASDTEAYGGHLRAARNLVQRAVDSAVRNDGKETAAIYLAIAAQREAAFGNLADARQTEARALKLAPKSRAAESEAALAFAMAGDRERGQSLAKDLEERFPLDTQMKAVWLPAIRAQLALDQKNPAAALHDTQGVSEIEFGSISFVNNVSCLYEGYVRGEAYLAAGQGKAAASEFQTILNHSGIVWNCWTGAMARLGLARANALQFRTSQGADADAARVRALAAYEDFLTLWKDADPEIPVLKQAKADYAKLR